jgi:uncharacterized membrane protein
MREIQERLDLTSLVAGIATVVVGTLILLQEDGAIDLEGGWLVAALAAATGVVLVASGMGARRG